MTGLFPAIARIVARMRSAPIPVIVPARPWSRTRALVALLAASIVTAGCGLLDAPSGDDAAPAAVEVTEEIVRCAAASTDLQGPAPSIDLGAVVVAAIADAERVPVDGGIEITFMVEIEALGSDETAENAEGAVDPSSLAILQARTAEEIAVLLRVDTVEEAGADRPGPASALSFERCSEPVRHEVTLLVTEPGCLVLVANDPRNGGFTELPVRVGVDGCTATPPPAPIG